MLYIIPVLLVMQGDDNDDGSVTENVLDVSFLCVNVMYRDITIRLYLILCTVSVLVLRLSPCIECQKRRGRKARKQ